MHPWLKVKFAKRYEIRIWTFLFVFSTLKCHPSPRLGIAMSKISIFGDIFYWNKMTHSCLKCPTMDQWLKLKFPKHQQIQIWNRHKQISLFRDIFDCSKVSHTCLKCSKMDQWLKLKFPKLHEIRIWTFKFEISASKCHLSPRLGIVITKLVYFEISFIETMWIILVWSVQLWTHG